MNMRLIFWILLTIALRSPAPDAIAQTDDDKSAFAEGRIAWQNHDCPIARQSLFKVSDAGRHGPWLIYAAHAEKCLGHLTSALTFLRSYDQEQPNEPAVTDLIASVKYTQDKVADLAEEVRNLNISDLVSSDKKRRISVVDVRTRDCTIAISEWITEPGALDSRSYAVADIVQLGFILPESIKSSTKSALGYSYQTVTFKVAPGSDAFITREFAVGVTKWDPFHSGTQPDDELESSSDDGWIDSSDTTVDISTFKADLIKVIQLCSDKK
jgi:hypothetical protein